MIVRCMRDYALVSGFCLLLNNAVLIVMGRAGAPLLASVVVSFAVCVVVGYALHGRVSFRQRLRFGAFARYVAAMSLNIPLAFTALWLCRDLVGWRIELAAPMATLATTAINFALCRFAVFGRREATETWVHP